MRPVPALLIALALPALAACNQVYSRQPLVGEAHEGGDPELRPGLWSLSGVNESCQFDIRKPLRDWPDCGVGLEIRRGQMFLVSGHNRLYAQSHWGTWRSDNGGDSWTEITAGLPSDFGMTMAAHPRNPDVAYVLPLVGGEFRCPPEGKLRVWKTSDAGASWQPMSEGLPQEDAFMGNYREGMCTDTLDPAGVYFGTNTGQLYASIDEGSTWRRLTSDLPPVSSVSATVLD